MNMKRIWFVFLIGIFLIGIVSAWSTNVFNHSLLQENMSFPVGASNITRYLIVPNTVSYLLNGYFNITGYTADTNSNYTSNEWKFDEGTGTKAHNENASSVNGTLMRDTKWVAGYDGIRYAVSFNGSAFINFTTANITNFSKPFSISFWMNSSLENRQMVILRLASNGNDNEGVLIYINNPAVNDRQIAFGIATVMHYNISNLTIDFMGKWKNIVATYNGGSTATNTSFKFYIDGVEQQCNNMAGEGGTDGNYLGMNNDYTFATSYNGSIDDLRIYSKNLTYDEIIVQYNGTNNAAVYIGTTPSNITISSNGTIPTTIRTDNLASILNSYLTAAYLVGSNYLIPFIFHSDGAGILSYSNLLFNSIGWTENSQTYNTTAFTQGSESFILNLTYDPSTYSAISSNLIYNGTSYIVTSSTDGTNTIFTRTLTIPNVNGARPFYWELIMTNNSGGNEYYNSTNQTQTVNSINFYLCNDTYKTLGINFTIYNESSNQLINATFKATFSYGASATKLKNLSVDLPANQSFKFCIDQNATYYVDSYIKLTATGLFDKIYTFSNDVITNSTTERSLYMMPTSDGRAVIIELKDENYQPLKGYTIKVYRKDPTLGVFTLIATDITDLFGQIVTTLVESTVKYKMEFYNQSGSLKMTTEEMTVACRTTVCILPFIITTPITDFDRFKNITNYAYSLIYNNNTRTFIFNWNDNTGESGISHRLEITKSDWNNTVKVYDTSSTALIGVLSFNLSSDKASYVAQAFRLSNTMEERRIDVLSAEVGNYSHFFGVEGMFWTFILLMTSLAIGYFYPPIGAGLFAIGFIVLGVMGVIYTNPAITISVIVLCVIFAWAFRG